MSRVIVSCIPEVRTTDDMLFRMQGSQASFFLKSDLIDLNETWGSAHRSELYSAQVDALIIKYYDEFMS